MGSWRKAVAVKADVATVVVTVVVGTKGARGRASAETGGSVAAVGQRSMHVKEAVNIGNEKIESLCSLELIGIDIDNKMNFNNRINVISRSVANSLNAIVRVRRFLE